MNTIVQSMIGYEIDTKAVFKPVMTHCQSSPHKATSDIFEKIWKFSFKKIYLKENLFSMVRAKFLSYSQIYNELLKLEYSEWLYIT